MERFGLDTGHLEDTNKLITVFNQPSNDAMPGLKVPKQKKPCNKQQKSKQLLQ